MKIAIVVAPFLLIGGYIAADYYQSSKESEILEAAAKKTAAFRLERDPACQLPTGKCVLKKNNLLLTLGVDRDSYHLQSSHALDGVTLGLAQYDRVTQPVQMQPDQDRKGWHTLMRPLSNLKLDSPLLLRLAVEQDDVRYYAEIEVSAEGPWSNSNGN